ncbi:MAG TPA: GGDEF domain-containing protein [Acidobacteriota bacterium]|nr:GGDEF domain-containing protein [Acidobacteriota bacterium]
MPKKCRGKIRLKNRRFFELSITEDFARVRRSFQNVRNETYDNVDDLPGISFFLIDVDHFKQVNDRFGHPSGDRILRQIGAAITSIVRESDTIIRWGGEEFLIVARNTRGNDCAILAERIRKQTASIPFIIDEKQTLQLTCSIGFSSWPFFRHDPDTMGWQEMIDLIDHCLYLAKNSGRNTWIGVSARPDYEGDTRPALLNSIADAEAEGIITIQSSMSSNSGVRDYQATFDTIHCV